MTSTLKLRQDTVSEPKSPALTRGLDLIASGLGLLLLFPVFLIISIAIKLTSDGPIFYKAKRVGRGGRLFHVYKFRSMYLDADRRGLGITVQQDPRVTPVGRILRRTKLDELPQLINVFRGEMSLVGPRPEDPRYVATYTLEQRQVLAVRPGITSLASRHFRNEEELLAGENPEKVYREKILPRKLAADLAYLQRRTFWTDVSLILETIFAVTNSGQRLTSIMRLRNRHFLVLDILALLIIPALALTLRTDGLVWWPLYIPALIVYTIVSLLVHIPMFHRLQLYDRYWRFAGVNDLSRVFIAVGLSSIILTALFIGMHPILETYNLAMYRTVPLIAGLLAGLFVGGFRFGMRAVYHWNRQRQLLAGGRRVLVVGAGEAGTMVVRELQANPQLDMEPAAFVDDDPNKIGTHVNGLPVLGPTESIPALVERFQIQRIVVAMPSAPLKRRKEIEDLCNQTGITTECLPGVYELLAGYKTLSRLPRVNIHQLLRRKPVEVNPEEAAACLTGKTVLVTGAGGSIGSELCRQVAHFKPKAIVLLGHGENSIFEIDLNLRLSYPGLITHPVIVDVRDERRVDWAVEQYRPDVIFHAAAHKHVPFMEESTEEAITNNVLGTRNVLRAAEKHGVGRLVMISTDKAVNPSCIMGATKRVGELLVMATARRSEQAYMAVRFGNVLGSRGSVIPVFQRQIAAGGPVTVTHPDMERYFMSIPEAVQLVLQAAVQGQGGEAFVLDMGEQIKILDLANDLIRLSGLEPGRDIDIVYSGIRPGEKLSEELFLESESYQRTKHKKIFVADRRDSLEPEALEHVVAGLVDLITQAQTPADVEQLRATLLQVCYYIDGYPSKRPPQGPASADQAPTQHPSLSPQLLPTGA